MREGKAIKINYVQQVWVYQISVQKDHYTHRIIKNLNHIVEFIRVEKSSEVRFLKKKFFILFTMFPFSSSLQIQRGKRTLSFVPPSCNEIAIKELL